MSELTNEQRERVHEIAAQCTGQCVHSPESLMTPEEDAIQEFHRALDELVFYCENCGWYCDADERHVGDFCDDCHDEREDGFNDE